MAAEFNNRELKRAANWANVVGPLQFGAGIGLIFAGGGPLNPVTDVLAGIMIVRGVRNAYKSVLTEGYATNEARISQEPMWRRVIRCAILQRPINLTITMPQPYTQIQNQPPPIYGGPGLLGRQNIFDLYPREQPAQQVETEEQRKAQQLQQEQAKLKQDRDQFRQVAIPYGLQLSRQIGTDIINQFGNVIGKGNFSEITLKKEDYTHSYDYWDTDTVGFYTDFEVSSQRQYHEPIHHNRIEGLQGDFAGFLWSNDDMNVLFGLNMGPTGYRFDAYAWSWKQYGNKPPNTREELIKEIAKVASHESVYENVATVDDNCPSSYWNLTNIPRSVREDSQNKQSSSQAFYGLIKQTNEKAFIRDARAKLSAGLEEYLRRYPKPSHPVGDVQSQSPKPSSYLLPDRWYRTPDRTHDRPPQHDSNVPPGFFPPNADDRKAIFPPNADDRRPGHFPPNADDRRPPHFGPNADDRRPNFPPMPPGRD